MKYLFIINPSVGKGKTLNYIEKIKKLFANGDTSNDHSYGRGLDKNGNIQAGYSGNPGEFQGGDLKGLTQKVNEGYFSDLGVNAIWITAPYEQVHGFTSGNFDGGSVTEQNGKGFPVSTRWSSNILW